MPDNAREPQVAYPEGDPYREKELPSVIPGHKGGAALEREIITPPPSNEPPGVPGVSQPHIRQGVYGPDNLPLPGMLIGQELADKIHNALERIAEYLQEQDRPDIFTLSFRANFPGGSPAWLATPIIQPQPGAALYVTSIWGFNSANVNAAFGYGTSAGDAAFFPSNVDAGSDLGALNNKAFQFNNDFPDWVFRCEPGTGLMIHAAGTCVIDGYLQYFARPLSEQKYR